MQPAEKPERKTYTLYSSQKHAETGIGNITKTILMEGDWKAEIERQKKEQQEENADYRRRKKAGETIPVRYHRRVVLGVPANSVESVPVHTAEPGDNVGPPTTQLVKKKGRQPVVLKEGTVLQPIVTGKPTVHLEQSRLAALLSPEQIERERTTFHLRLTPHTGNTLYVLGSSKRGKSTAIMKIYDDYFGGADRNYVSILWSVNPQIGAYKGHSKLIKAAWNRIETPALIKIEQKIQRRTGNEYKFLNIFDDVLHVRGDQVMEDLIMTYRNSKMSSIIAMQYTNQLQKNCRANINGVLLFGFNTDEAIEVVIKCYLRGFLHTKGIVKLPDQINWYKRVTDDHGFIYVIPETGEVTLHRFRM